MRAPDRSHTVQVPDGVQLAVYEWNARAPPPAKFRNKNAVVLVHQYSKMGGCSALMRGMALHFANRGFPVVTFDCRGVGRSSGASTFRGLNEVKDVEAVCRWVQDSMAHDVILLGSSAGAPIAGSAAAGLSCVKAYIGVGYVFGWLASCLFGAHFSAVVDAEMPKLLIQGDRDGFTPVPLLHRKATEAKADVRVVPGVGHFELEGETYDEYIADVAISWISDQMSLLAA